MTFIDAPAGSAELICRNKAPQICRPCADRHAREGASGAVPKHWRKAWRVTCPACGAPLSDTNERPDIGETLRDTSPFAHVWKEALAGEAIIERFLRGDSSFDYSPIALMRALLVQTWRPCGANGRDPVVGWALGTIFPEFDDLARPIKRRINHAAVAALPISFRPAARLSLPTCVMAAGSRRVADCFSAHWLPTTALSCAITMIAKAALERAGIRSYAHQGAHLFRHSLATELLRSGATLSQIGQLLRHENHDTTRIYAKVDFEALRPLSLPWPGGVQ